MGAEGSHEKRGARNNRLFILSGGLEDEGRRAGIKECLLGEMKREKERSRANGAVHAARAAHVFTEIVSSLKVFTLRYRDFYSLLSSLLPSVILTFTLFILLSISWYFIVSFFRFTFFCISLGLFFLFLPYFVFFFTPFPFFIFFLSIF